MKNIAIKDDTWKAISNLKIKLGLKTLDAVISLMYNIYTQVKGAK